MESPPPPPLEEFKSALPPAQAAPTAPHVRDEDGNLSSAFVHLISDAIEACEGTRIKMLTEDVHEADMGALLEALSADQRPRMVELLGADFDFAALTEVDDTIREDILDELAPETVAQGVRDLDIDDAVYILEDLDAADQADILQRLTPVERVALQRSLDYPEHSAGRRMQTQVIALPPFWTVGQTIDYLRTTEGLPERFFEIFVTDPSHHLLGAVALDQLMRTKRPVPLADIMDTDPQKIEATADQDDVARMFQRYNLVSAPAVDASGRLVGVLTVDDAVDMIDEEADSDLKALGGVSGDEEVSDTVATITKSRFGWLFINLLTAFLAASVMKLFESELEKMVALAVLAPIVASQGGNAATQTMTVTVRALATQELGAWNFSRFINRELWVGFLNGIGFALITGVLAGFWFSNVGLGVVIGSAMVSNLVAGALAGVLVPIVLDKSGFDPAVASGTFVTTVTDVVGFFAFLGIATWWFKLL
jgi:magnesium transporter